MILAALEIVKGTEMKKAAIRNFLDEKSVYNALNRLAKQGLVEINANGNVKADIHQKMEMACLALKLGASLNEVSNRLDWADFEELACQIFRANNYDVKRHVILSGRREIDILARKREIYIAADCKHWRRPLYPSYLTKVINMQIERIKIFLKTLPMSGIRVYPMVIVLQRHKEVFFKKVPIIPINYLNDFLLNFEGLKDWLFSVLAST